MPNLFRNLAILVVEEHGTSPHARARSAAYAVATRAGTDAEQLLKHAVLRLIEDKAQSPLQTPELPVWKLGATSSFHRRDLYDDVPCAGHL